MNEMLQKNKNVAKNVANENSQDLTEQWKKGELPEGHYYIKTRSETNIDEYIQWYKDHGIPSEKSFAYFNVQQVLAPVPSYDEWKASYNCMLENEVLRLKNAQLKEQINKCCLDAINRGTANTVKAVKEFGMPERIEELVEQNAQLKEYVQITSISVDMSTEEAPYNRIYAKPVEKQGDVLLCEFESANYDIEQKELRTENAQLKELLKECREEIASVEWDSVANDRNQMKLLTKIDEVLK